MRDLLQKTCLFLFLATVLAGKGSDLGALTGALTGTILLWPFYKKYVPQLPKRRRVVVEVAADAESASE